ncbi:MAG: hypothetical protein ACRDU0_15010, partial [Mycobacterium sp.]
NGSVLRLVGGLATNHDIVEVFSDVLGRRVKYIEITDEQWAAAASTAGVNPVAVEHLSHLWRYLRTRPPEYLDSHPSDTIERLTGQPPQSFPEFLHQQRELFVEAGVR